MQIKLPYLQWLSMEKVRVSCITSPVQWQQCKTGISTVLAMEMIQGYGVSSPLAIYTHLCTFFFLQNWALWDICLMHCGICEMGLNNWYLVSTVDTDGLVLQQQGISRNIIDYTPMRFDYAVWLFNYRSDVLAQGWSHAKMFSLYDVFSFFFCSELISDIPPWHGQQQVSIADLWFVLIGKTMKV